MSEITTAVVLDTETTGFAKPIVPVQVCMIELEGADPRSFAIGSVFKKEFNPGKDIELGAMSTHYLSNEAVKGYSKWDPRMIPASVDAYIGHSIDYDWEAVGSPADVKRICTFAMAKRAWPDVDSHKLGALLIHVLGPAEAIPLLKNAHQADVDAANTIHLVRALANEWDIATWEEFHALSEECRIPLEMTFGKHGPDKAAGKKGMSIVDMVKNDWSYCTWLLKLEDLDPYLRRAIENAKATQ